MENEGAENSRKIFKSKKQKMETMYFLSESTQIMLAMLRSPETPAHMKTVILNHFNTLDTYISGCCKNCGSLMVSREKFVNVNGDFIANTESFGNLEWCENCNEETRIVEFQQFYLKTEDLPEAPTGDCVIVMDYNEGIIHLFSFAHTTKDWEEDLEEINALYGTKFKPSECYVMMVKDFTITENFQIHDKPL